MEWTVGKIVRFKTVSGDNVEGEVFGYDSGAKVVALQHRPTHSTLKRNVRFVKVDCIAGTVETIGEEDARDFAELPAADMEAAKQREERAVAHRMEQQRRAKLGIPLEAQGIFDALTQTYPCSWDEPDIVLMETVRISPPYTAEACSGPDARAVERVKKVVGGIRNRMTAAREASLTK